MRRRPESRHSELLAGLCGGKGSLTFSERGSEIEPAVTGNVLTPSDQSGASIQQNCGVIHNAFVCKPRTQKVVSGVQGAIYEQNGRSALKLHRPGVSKAPTADCPTPRLINRSGVRFTSLVKPMTPSTHDGLLVRLDACLSRGNMLLRLRFINEYSRLVMRSHHNGVISVPGRLRFVQANTGQISTFYKNPLVLAVGYLSPRRLFLQ